LVANEGEKGVTPKKAFIYGVGTALAGLAVFSFYRELKRRQLETAMAAELKGIMKEKVKANALLSITEGEIKDWAEWAAKELVLHGYTALKDYKNLDSEINAIIEKRIVRMISGSELAAAEKNTPSPDNNNNKNVIDGNLA